MVAHYCGQCTVREVAFGASDPAVCSGQFPFQCCCICAAAGGWKGWKESGCWQCKATAGDATHGEEPTDTPPPIPHRRSGPEAHPPRDLGGGLDAECDTDMEAAGFVNRRGNKQVADPASEVFTFASLRKRTSFMKAKAAAMHAKEGIAVDNEDEDDENSQSREPDSTMSRNKIPLEDAPLEVLREGWLLKQSKTLKVWQKKYFVLDSVALYWAKSPHDVPDGFYPIRKCQFLLQGESGCFEVITSGGRSRMQVLRYKTAEGKRDLEAWTACYTNAMNDFSFPYFHVHQTCRRDVSLELLLGVCKGGLRLVKLGLYDPGREEEIAFYTYSEIYEWGCPDLETFEFCATTERAPYVLQTLHASDIEAMVHVKFARWKEARKRRALGHA